MGSNPESIYIEGLATLIGNDSTCLIICLCCLFNSSRFFPDGSRVSRPYSIIENTNVHSRLIDVVGSSPFSPCRPVCIRLYKARLDFLRLFFIVAKQVFC